MGKFEGWRERRGVEGRIEDYLKVKKLVLDEIANKLEKNKKLDIDIYNIGCR